MEPPAPATTIADATASCLQHFSRCLSAWADADADCKITTGFVDSKQRFDLWTDDLGARHPPDSKKSADYRLSEAPALAKQLSSLLHELHDALQDAGDVATGVRPDQSELSSGSSGSEDGLSLPEDVDDRTELEVLQSAIANLITSLLKITVYARKWTRTDRFLKASASTVDPILPDRDIMYIEDKCPKTRGDNQRWLREKLGKAITLRRQVLRYNRDHSHRVAHVSKPAQQPHTGAPQHPLLPGLGKNILPSGSYAPSARPTFKSTEASAIVFPYANIEPNENLLTFKDEDDGITLVSLREEEAQDEDLKVVLLSSINGGQKIFKCPYCHTNVEIADQRQWE